MQILVYSVGVRMISSAEWPGMSAYVTHAERLGTHAVAALLISNSGFL